MNLAVIEKQHDALVEALFRGHGIRMQIPGAGQPLRYSQLYKDSSMQDSEKWSPDSQSQPITCLQVPKTWNAQSSRPNKQKTLNIANE